MKLLFVLLLLFPIISFAAVEVEKPKIILNGIAQDLHLKVSDSSAKKITVMGLGEYDIKDGVVSAGKVIIPDPLVVNIDNKEVNPSVPRIPAVLSLLPPLVAIFFAFILKEVFISLFLGVYIGTLFLCDFAPFKAFYSVFNDKFVGALTDSSHIKILMFTLGMAAFIGVLRKSGALVDMISRVKSRISTPRSGMVATWISGLIIFFDDYANSLLIGNMLRPLTDKLRISREKLSFIVDATAAPVASLALSTWIGTEISLMEDAYKTIDPNVSGMSIFIGTIPFRFYSILTIVFVGLICFLNRDYGPMKTAERRARETGKVLADDAMPMQDDESEAFDAGRKDAKWFLAAIPIASMIIFIVSFIYISGATAVGFDKPIRDILDSASTSSSLMFGPIVGIVMFYTLGFKHFKLTEYVSALIQGTKTIIIAVFILTLAWSIGGICKELGTANYLITLFGDTLSPAILPSVAFILSAIIAFSTGTSWGTMAIMFPIIVPLVHHILGVNHVPQDIYHNVLYGTMGSILAGACLGDHSSPISDTTLFSSMASGSDHIHHVRTQIPYVMTVGLISIVFGYIPIAFGIHWGVSLVSGALACFLVIRFLGEKNIE